MEPFDLDTAVAALHRDGSSQVVAPAPGPPLRIDGFTVGAPVLTANPPHRGEMHPDGDELLYLIAGRIEVIIENGGTQTTVGAEAAHTLSPGQAIIVPRGAWHRVNVREPSHLVHITPGPRDGHRPLG
jgi:mannose-6-phosphate isomerase-like protein (cupin superfamily)